MLASSDVEVSFQHPRGKLTNVIGICLGSNALFIIFSTSHHYQPPPPCPANTPWYSGWIRFPPLCVPTPPCTSPFAQLLLWIGLTVCESVFPPDAKFCERRNYIFFIVFPEAGSCLEHGTHLSTFFE